MSRVRVHNLTISLDGFAAGPEQSLSAPMGLGTENLHRWLFSTSFGADIIGREGGTTGADDALARAGDDGVGATIMGRNMFGPVRGEWPDAQWTGWWGVNPPYHHPVFVLTHHARDPIVMQGGTTFSFITGGIESALEQARSAANGADVRIGGGASTVRQFVAADLVDELHLAVSPVILGSGERLFDNTGQWSERFDVVPLVSEGEAAHFTLTRRR
jgi:dihydrofolate reductase